MTSHGQEARKGTIRSLIFAAAAAALPALLAWAVASFQGRGCGYVPVAVWAGSFLLFVPLFFQLLNQKERLEKAEEEARQAHLLDETTRLYKSRVFEELAESQIRLCRRNNWQVGMAVLDIDGLERINERYGYEAGNRVLRRFATALKETLRESDLVARFDDDRFVVMLPRCDIADASRVVRRFQERVLSEPVEAEGGERVGVSFSSGVVAFAGKIAKFEQMFTRATGALEEAKRKGGNRIEKY